MQILCHSTAKNVGPILEENIQFFIEAANKPEGYWKNHTVHVVKALLGEHAQAMDRASKEAIEKIAIAVLGAGETARIKPGVQSIFRANGWDPDSLDLVGEIVSQHSQLEPFFIEMHQQLFTEGLTQGDDYWKHRSIHINSSAPPHYLYTMPEAETRADRATVEFIARGIFSSNTIPMNQKVAVAFGVRSISKGHEWPLEELHVITKWIQNGETTEIPTPLLFCLDVPMLSHHLQEDGEVEAPCIQAPANTSAEDFTNFINRYYYEYDLDSFSLSQLAGLFSIAHHLNYDEKTITVDMSRYIFRSTMTSKRMNQIFHAAGAKLPQELASLFLAEALDTYLADRPLKEACQKLQSLPNYPLVRLIPFSAEASLKELFPNINFNP